MPDRSMTVAVAAPDPDAAVEYSSRGVGRRSTIEWRTCVNGRRANGGARSEPPARTGFTVYRHPAPPARASSAALVRGWSGRVSNRRAICSWPAAAVTSGCRYGAPTRGGPFDDPPRPDRISHRRRVFFSSVERPPIPREMRVIRRSYLVSVPRSGPALRKGTLKPEDPVHSQRRRLRALRQRGARAARSCGASASAHRLHRLSQDPARLGAADGPDRGTPRLAFRVRRADPRRAGHDRDHRLAAIEDERAFLGVRPPNTAGSSALRRLPMPSGERLHAPTSTQRTRTLRAAGRLGSHI